MAARFWKWRMQGGAVTLAKKALEAEASGFRPDLIFATDMVNVPAFLALTREKFADVPLVFFLHENQLTYPIPKSQERDFTYAYVNYLSCLAADHIIFNSAFHRDEFMEALPSLLRMFPDYTHPNTAHRIRSKASVLHLGMELEAHDRYQQDAVGPRRDPEMVSPVVLWNQRWEYDKNPEAFFRVMNRLDDVGCTFKLILAGEYFEQQPREFERAFERYADRILHYGYAKDFAEYSALLHRSDIVVSTSVHEFFGVAIMEAIYCGCHPLLPNRLSYPELIPESLHAPLLHAKVLYEDEEELFATMESILRGRDKLLPVAALKSIPARLDWQTHVRNYDDLFERVVAEAHKRARTGTVLACD